MVTVYARLIVGSQTRDGPAILQNLQKIKKWGILNKRPYLGRFVSCLRPTMTKHRNKAVPAVYLLLRKSNDILLMRRQNTGYYDGWYSVPAGHVEKGELPLDALVREAEEELGIVIEKSDVRLSHIMYRTKHDETGDRVDLFFIVTEWSGDIINREPHKCNNIQWFPLHALPENIMHHVREAIVNIEKSVVYSELPLERIAGNPS